MKNIILTVALLAVCSLVFWGASCSWFTKNSTPSTTPSQETVMPGSDRDAHGCIPSAGYTWCEAKQKCLRTWEEECK